MYAMRKAADKTRVRSPPRWQMPNDSTDNKLTEQTAGQTCQRANQAPAVQPTSSKQPKHASGEDENEQCVMCVWLNAETKWKADS